MNFHGNLHKYSASRYDQGSIGASSAGHTSPPAAKSAGNLRISTNDYPRGADYDSQHSAIPSLNNGSIAGTNSQAFEGNAISASSFPTASDSQFADGLGRAYQTGWDSRGLSDSIGHGPGGPNTPRAQAQSSRYHPQEYQMDLNHSRSQQHSHYPGGIPGSLQPGGSARPGPTSANTAPSAVPTLPPISTQTQLSSNSSRGTMANHSHSYSQGSPAGFDQPRHPHHMSTPDESKFASPPSNRYTASRPPQNTVYSPLGLADIRPRGDTAMSDGQASANPYSESFPAVPSNCNYLAPWAVYAFDWCKWPVNQHGMGDSAGKMAIGSYLEDGHNFIQILETQIVPEPEPEQTSGAPQYGVEYVKTAEATHSYPVTRILWEPESPQKQSTDLLATSGDHLRLWSLPAQTSHNHSNSITRSANTGKDSIPQKLTPLALLSNSKSPEHTAPLTSLDWNTLSPSLIITSSIDTTCTIWDIPSLTAKTQLIAHDKEVFDVRFCAHSVDVFVSCGADGSVRMFDLRSLEHSTIIYEPSEKPDKTSSSPGDMSPTKAQQTLSYAPPLLRLAASPHDAHLLATFSQDSNMIRVLDVRQPGQALLELQGHGAAINCMEWSPTRRGLLASGGDDSLVLIWDLLAQGASANLGLNGNPQIPGQPGPDISRAPTSSWQCDYEVGNLSWAPRSGLTSQGSEWLGVSGGRGIWAVNL